MLHECRLTRFTRSVKLKNEGPQHKGFRVNALNLRDRLKLEAAFKPRPQRNVLLLSSTQGLLGDLFAALAKVIADVVDDPATCDDAVSAIESLFDEYIATVNIQVIPDWMEPTIKLAMRNTIRPTVEALFALVEGRNAA